MPSDDLKSAASRSRPGSAHAEAAPRRQPDEPASATKAAPNGVNALQSPQAEKYQQVQPDNGFMSHGLKSDGLEHYNIDQDDLALDSAEPDKFEPNDNPPNQTPPTPEYIGKFDPETQPDAETGVTEDMATLAINPEFFRNLTAAEAQRTSGDFAGMDDAQIMLRLSAGDMAAFDVLLQKYRKPIIHFMYRMVHNEAIAEELAQEVFLRVYRSRETYRAEARFSTWLYRIATNLGVNHARDTHHERAASTVYLDEADSDTGITPEVADQTPGAEAKMLYIERLAAIKEHVLALPERQRMAVLLHKYEGMDYKQIGQVLKLSESATKSLLFRAYQTLREKLAVFL